MQNWLLAWLKLAAQLQVRKNQPTIIGVTGSAGKTSAVGAIGDVLTTQYQVETTAKGNSETGIPFELLNIPVKNYVGWQWLWVSVLSIWKLITYWLKYELLIVEMGIDSDQPPKNMTYLLEMIQPQVGIMLNVNSVHGQNFAGTDTTQAIADEKGKLLTSLPQDGLAVYSQDHPQIQQVTASILAPQKTFSIKKSADCQLLEHEVSLSGTKFVFLLDGQQHILQFKNQAHFVEAFGDFASALLVGQHFGIKTIDAIFALEKNFQLLPGRMSFLKGIRDSVILDSSYNSSLEPTSAALQMLNQVSVRGKKIAILGDMREIGSQEKHDHQQLAKTAVETVDTLIWVGPLTKKYVRPELKKLKFEGKAYFFDTAYQAANQAVKLIEPHDLILVKGSQNTIFLEIVVKAIMAQPANAADLLCRQTKYWHQQRQKLIN